MSSSPSEGDSRRDRLESFSRVTTLLTTNLSKLVGLYVGVRALGHGEKAQTLGFAALLVIGGQAAESIVLRFIERLFGMDE